MSDREVQSCLQSNVLKSRRFNGHQGHIPEILRFLGSLLWSWVVDFDQFDREEAESLWDVLYCRMLRVSWTQRETNVEILRRMDKEKEVLNTVKGCKLQYLDLGILCETSLNTNCSASFRARWQKRTNRRWISWLKNLRTWFGRLISGLFRAATNKIMIA